MKAIWIGMIILAMLHIGLALFSFAFGSFADGGSFWEFLVMTAIHPAAAIALLVMVTWRRPPAVAFVVLAALVLANVAADASISASILLGSIRGDWWIPLIFSVVPVIGLAYALAITFRNRPPAVPAPAAAV